MVLGRDWSFVLMLPITYPGQAGASDSLSPCVLNLCAIYLLITAVKGTFQEETLSSCRGMAPEKADNQQFQKLLQLRESA